MDLSLDPTYSANQLSDLELLGSLDFEPAIEDAAFTQKSNRVKKANVAAITIHRKNRQSSRCMTRRHQDTHLDIDLLLGAPLDVLLEIFKELHPIDLIHLHNSNLRFRDALDFLGDGLWKAAYQQTSGLPTLPRRLTYQRWTKLVFGPQTCQECGRYPAPLNLVFPGRLCETCYGKRFSTICFEDPSTAPLPTLCSTSAFSMLLFTNQHEAYYGTRDWPTYLSAEVKRVAQQLKILERDVEWGVEDAVENLERYKAERSAIMSDIQRTLSTFRHWELNLEVEVDNMVRPKLDRMEARLKRRLLSLYNPKDVNLGAYREILTAYIMKTGVLRLNQRRFTQVRLLVEPGILERQEIRMAEERMNLITARKSFVSAAYREYVKTTSPTSRVDVPPTHAVQNHDAFKSLINRTDNDPLTDQDLEEAWKDMPAFFNDWRQTKMRELASALPSQSHASNSNDQEPDILAIDLATSVFYCKGSARGIARKSGRCLIGWEYLSVHLRCGALEHYWDKRLHFSQPGHEAATELVRLCGLDPINAMAWDMDGLDHRVVCLICPEDPAHGREAWTWREAVRHYLVAGHTIPSWGILGPEVAAELKLREGPNLCNSQKSWCCAHCSDYMVEYNTRRIVMRHVRKRHNIDRPVFRLDYTYLGDQSDYYKKVTIAKSSKACDNVCLRCPDQVRLFTEQGMQDHLRMHHYTFRAVKNTHYRRVSVIAKATILPDDTPDVPLNI